MPTSTERQTSFGAGELAPTFWGRTDHDAFATGARKLLNFIVGKHGVVMNRAGTQYVAPVDPPASWDYSTERPLIVPMDIGADEAALLVFIAGYYSAGARTEIWVYEKDADGVYELVDKVWFSHQPTVFSKLGFAQVGYTLFIHGTDLAPKKLTRVAANNYQLETLDFSRAAQLPAWGNVYLGGSPGDNSAAGNSSHPAREWTYAYTFLIKRGEDGVVIETAKANITTFYDSSNPGVHSAVPDEIAVYPDWTMKLVFDEFTDSGDDTIVGFRVYRGRDGQFGYVGEYRTEANAALANGATWVDDGRVPRFEDPPPLGTNPVADDGNPAAMCHFEDRRLFGGFADFPSRLRGSKIGDYLNFDEVIVADEDDAYNFTLSASRAEVIRAMVARKQLIVLSSRSEWLVSGSGEQQALTPTSFRATPVSRHGCAATPRPAEAANDVFFIERKGSRPIVLRVDQETGAFQSFEVGELASHLFDGYTIVSWAYAAHPFSILWAVRSDGALLSLTYAPEQKILAWAKHELADDGIVEAVAVVEDGTEDIAYIVVRRDTTRSLERIAPRILSDIRDAMFLDRAVSYDGRNTDEDNTATVTDAYAGEGAIGTNVDIEWASDPGVAVGDIVQIDDPDDGLPMQFEVVSNVSGFRYECQVTSAPVSDDLWDEPTDAWAICANTVSGLAHLDGLTVTALADGNVVNDLTVTGGSVAFTIYYGVIHVGRGYYSDLETLPVGRERGRQKNVKAMHLELEASRAGYVGPDLDDDGENLTQVRTREVSDGYTAVGLKRYEPEVNIKGRWGKAGAAAYRQVDPLPVCIVGLTREVEYGG
jgi:hypothetical protein